MFERFADDARAVVVDAQTQARRLGHNYIGCEHFLLCIASTDTEVGEVFRQAGVTANGVEAAVVRLVGSPTGAIDRNALAAIGIDLDVVRSKIEASLGPHAWAPAAQRRGRWLRRRRCDTGFGHIPFTPRAKKCLQLSLHEALGLGHHRVGVEHIALALTTMTEGLAPAIFAATGASPAQLRTQLLGRYRQAG